jgi:hypothetical protein
MRCHHPVCGSANTIAVSSLLDVLADGAAGCVLHRDALRRGTLAEAVLFVIGESQGHRHGAMVSV